ncbi:anti-sigma factor, partial [Mesorhizobium sp. M2E.F.Ca.ET.209.01.1.1]
RVTAMPAGVAWAAAAALLALVLVQSFEQPGGKGNDFEVAGTQDDLAKLPFALVKFKADAKMSDITSFLGQNGLKIAGGPTADGVFHLTIPASTAADYDKIVGLVAAQPFADAVIQ